MQRSVDMLVQNKQDLSIANRVYGNTSTVFGWAGRNAEYAKYYQTLRLSLFFLKSIVI